MLLKNDFGQHIKCLYLGKSAIEIDYEVPIELCFFYHVGKNSHWQVGLLKLKINKRLNIG